MVLLISVIETIGLYDSRNSELKETCRVPQGSILGPLFLLCLTGRPCGTRLGPGGPDSSKSSSQAKKPT